MERLVSFLIEEYAGQFPLWLAPIQCRIVPVQDDSAEVLAACDSLAKQMRQADLRVEVDNKPGVRMQARIREAESQKVPYVVVIGKRDVERGDNVFNLRNTRSEAQEAVAAADLVARLQKEVAQRSAN